MLVVKGNDSSRFDRVLYDDGSGNMKLNLGKASSVIRPINFRGNPGDVATYFTNQLWTAEQYARWDTKRADVHSTAVFLMDVPNSFIATIHGAEIRYGGIRAPEGGEGRGVRYAFTHSSSPI